MSDDLIVVDTGERPAAPATPVRKLTKRAFQNRFPKSVDGVSTKYDWMTLFLADDGYAESLNMTGAPLYQLRALIMTGKNRMDSSKFVDYDAPDAANFTFLLTQPSIPESFRLTVEERAAIMDTPVAPGEMYVAE